MFSVNGKAGGDSSSGFCDPLTGGSRYVPAQSNAALNSASSSGDPFTGTGRYVPGQSSVPLNTVPSTGDPFTGSGRYVAGTQPVAAATHSSSYFPVRDFLRFDQANIEAISSNLKKIFKKIVIQEFQDDFNKALNTYTDQKEFKTPKFD